MPLKYKVLHDRKLVYVTGEGRITISELLDHLDVLARDPAYQAPMKKLIDYRNCEPMHLSSLDIMNFSEKKASYKDVFAGEKCAIITSDKVDYGMARMHGALIEQEKIDTRVFRDFPEALAWLAVQAADDELRIT